MPRANAPLRSPRRRGALRVRATALALALALVPSTYGAWAGTPAPRHLEVDGDRSELGFGLRVLIRQLEGRFLSLRGSVDTDAGGALADVHVEADAQSVWMPRESHARWARSPEFFDAERYPRIAFDATAVPLEIFRNGGELDGWITLRGRKAPVRWTVEPADCDRPGEDCPVRASTSVERTRFGMSSKRLVVGDRVSLTFDIRLRPAADSATADARVPGTKATQ